MAASGCLQLKHVDKIMRGLPRSYPHLRQLQRTAKVGPGTTRIDEWPNPKTGVDIRGKGFSRSGSHRAGKAARSNRGKQRSRGQQFNKRTPAIPTVLKLKFGQGIFLSCFRKTELFRS